MVYVGSGDDTATALIMDRIMSAETEDLDSSIARFLGLALGLVYMVRVQPIAHFSCGNH